MTWTNIREQLPPFRVDLLVKWARGGITGAIAYPPSIPGEKIDFDTLGVSGQDREWMWDDPLEPYNGVTHWRLMVAGPDEQIHSGITHDRTDAAETRMNTGS